MSVQKKRLDNELKLNLCNNCKSQCVDHTSANVRTQQSHCKTISLRLTQLCLYTLYHLCHVHCRCIKLQCEGTIMKNIWFAQFIPILVIIMYTLATLYCHLYDVRRCAKVDSRFEKRTSVRNLATVFSVVYCCTSLLSLSTNHSPVKIFLGNKCIICCLGIGGVQL